jgi:hypothetical protein
MQDDEEMETDDAPPAPEPTKSKKKKEKKATKTAFADLMSDDDEVAEKSIPPEVSAEAAIDVMTTPVDSLTSIEQVTECLAATGISKTRKQLLKQRLQKLEVYIHFVCACCDGLFELLVHAIFVQIYRCKLKGKK